MSLDLPYGIRNIKFGGSADVDEMFGPYDSIALAVAAVTAGMRKGGRRVGIKDGLGNVSVFWWKNDAALGDGNLVPFVPVNTDASFGEFLNSLGLKKPWDLNDKISFLDVSTGKAVYMSISDLLSQLTALYQTKIKTVNSNITAINDDILNIYGDCVITDPAPVTARGFVSFVRNGNATIGGEVYTEGSIVYRIFHVGGFRNYLYLNKLRLDQLYQPADKDILISSNTTIPTATVNGVLVSAWSGQTIYVDAPVLITVPSNLPDFFKFTFIVKTGGQISWAITAPHVWYRPTPGITYEDSTGFFGKERNTNFIQLRFG